MLGKYKFNWFWIVFLLVGSGILISYVPPETSYAYPLGNYKALAGTFGELRNNHFHSGIDIKTYRKIGIPVKAASDGYIYRLKTSPFGFGRAVYIKHDDGNFSVYAHLDRFIGTYDSLVRKRQFKEEKFEQEIYLPRDQIRVKKGQVIGYSGNSGSSYGPHLHFEIRDKDEKIINPLGFYNGKVSDHIPPILQEVAFEPLKIDSRVEGKWNKLRLTPTKTSNGEYKINDLIRVKGEIGIEYMAFDRLDEASNKCGINYAKLFLDGKLIHEFRLDTFSFDESRQINMHIDYAHYKDSKRKFERAYIMDGNDFSAYKYLPRHGIIELNDDKVHHFSLQLKDFAGNQSTLKGRLIRDNREAVFPKNPTYSRKATFQVEEKYGVIKISATNPSKECREGLLYENILGELKSLKPSYHIGRKMVFLLPLNRYDYPVSLDHPNGGDPLLFHYYEELFPDQNNLIELDELQVFFPYKTIFSSQHLQVQKSPGNRKMYSDIFEVGNKHIPINSPYLISFKAPESYNRDKMVVAKWVKSKWEYAGNVQGNAENIYASLREFGRFCLMADSVKPTINAINFVNKGAMPLAATELVLRIDDDFSGINHQMIEGSLDGKWIPMEYFFRQDKIRYDFKGNRPTKGSHKLVVKVMDNSGNQHTAQYELRF